MCACMKYPQVLDGVRAVEELDRKQWRVLVNMLSDLRANYAVIYDTITKVDHPHYIHRLHSYCEGLRPLCVPRTHAPLYLVTRVLVQNEDKLDASDASSSYDDMHVGYG